MSTNDVGHHISGRACSDVFYGQKFNHASSSSNGWCASVGAVVTGSHIDAIPLAGAYDGTLGVIGAIAALKALREADFRPERPIDALMFTSEEPTRFGLGCIGR